MMMEVTGNDNWLCMTPGKPEGVQVRVSDDGDSVLISLGAGRLYTRIVMEAPIDYHAAKRLHEWLGKWMENFA